MVSADAFKGWKYRRMSLLDAFFGVVFTCMSLVATVFTSESVLVERLLLIFVVPRKSFTTGGRVEFDRRCCGWSCDGRRPYSVKGSSSSMKRFARLKLQKIPQIASW